MRGLMLLGYGMDYIALLTFEGYRDVLDHEHSWRLTHRDPDDGHLMGLSPGATKRLRRDGRRLADRSDASTIEDHAQSTTPCGTTPALRPRSRHRP